MAGNHRFKDNSHVRVVKLSHLAKTGSRILVFKIIFMLVSFSLINLSQTGGIMSFSLLLELNVSTLSLHLIVVCGRFVDACCKIFEAEGPKRVPLIHSFKLNLLMNAQSLKMSF
jgi:hypothetical protein